MNATFNFKVNGISFEFELSYYMGNFYIGGTESNNVGQVITGYIKDNRFYMQSHIREVFYFENQLIKSAIKEYNKITGSKVKA